MLRVFLALLWISLGLAACGGEPPKDIAKNPEVQKGRDALHRGDYAEALRILMPLAEQGEARAMNVIGYMYDYGKGLSSDHVLACDWYGLSAESGDPRGQRNFGICFRDGIGREKDEEAVEVWFTRSAHQGNVRSMVSLMNFYNSKGNISQLKHWGQLAAQKGNVPAKLAMHSAGLGQGIPEVSFSEWLCFHIQIEMFGKKNTSCDS